MFYLRLNSDEMNIDCEQLERVATLDVQPHVLILPSELQHCIKEVNGQIVMNPHRLSKGESGGVFARMLIKGVSRGDGTSNTTGDNKGQDPFAKQFSAEIIRI